MRSNKPSINSDSQQLETFILEKYVNKSYAPNGAEDPLARLQDSKNSWGVPPVKPRPKIQKTQSIGAINPNRPQRFEMTNSKIRNLGKDKLSLRHSDLGQN